MASTKPWLQEAIPVNTMIQTRCEWHNYIRRNLFWAAQIWLQSLQKGLLEYHRQFHYKKAEFYADFIIVKNVQKRNQHYSLAEYWYQRKNEIKLAHNGSKKIKLWKKCFLGFKNFLIHFQVSVFNFLGNILCYCIIYMSSTIRSYSEQVENDTQNIWCFCG